MSMSDTIEQVIERGKNACIEHGFPFISIYQTRCEEFVADGWDRFIIAPNHVSETQYRYLGFVRADGTPVLPFYDRNA